jgi:hypothetical protein
MRVQFAILASVILLSGCEKIAARHWNVPTDDPNWLAGYKEGLSQGVDQGRDNVCGEIFKYKQSVARDLDENTEICGHDQWDQPGKGAGSAPSHP